MSAEALSAANNGNIFARKATKVGAILTVKKQMVLLENSIIKGASPGDVPCFLAIEDKAWYA